MDKYAVKLKCGSCNKNKSREFFSKTAIAKYQESQRKFVRDPKQPVKSINCLACNNGNREELQCSLCGKTKALDQFNKAQRRKGDDALCLDCSQEKIDREAEYQKELDEIKIMEDLKRDESIGQSFHAMSSRISSAQRSRLDSANSRLETETNPSSEDWAHGNDAVSLVSSGSSGHTSSINARPVTGTGWDGYPQTNRTTTASSGSNLGFAKQNAVPKDPWEKAREQLERERRRAQEQDEVERDESDDDDDDDDNHEGPY